MRIIFMGTPDIAVPSLQTILDENYPVIGVITQPDKPKGRGKHLSPSPIKEFASARGLSVYTPISVRKDPNFINFIRQDLLPDLIIIVAFGQILPPTLLEIPKFGCINVHFSLLPKYRGAAPVAWALINGEKDTGVTTMFLNEKMDEGDIIYQSTMSIKLDDNRLTLENKLADLGAKLLIKTVKDIENNIAPRIPQNHHQASYAPRLKSEDGLIDWTQSAQNIHNCIRGLYPDPGAYSFYNHRRIKFIKSIPGADFKLDSIYPAGMVVSISKESGIGISTGRGILLIKSLQPEGKNVLSCQEFCNGYRVKIGDQFKSNILKDNS